jgi:hypothetical protein
MPGLDKVKIVFLDIDGVLNSYRTAYAMGPMKEEDGLDPIAVGLVREMCRLNKAGVVISSTWRLGRDAQDFVILFERYGWKNPTVIGVTPTLSTGHRGKEIKAWLSGNSSITDFVVVDDDNYDTADDFPDNFVHVDSKEGFLYRDFIKCSKILTPDYSKVSNHINVVDFFDNYNEQTPGSKMIAP